MHAQRPVSRSTSLLYFALIRYGHCIELGRLVLNTFIPTGLFTLQSQLVNASSGQYCDVKR